MLSCVLRHSTIGCLLLSLVFFAGTIPSLYACAEAPVPVQCCEKEGAPQFPEDEGECSECRCLNCGALLNAFFSGMTRSGPASEIPNWLLLEEHPSNHIQSIDYPPELG